MAERRRRGPVEVAVGRMLRDLDLAAHGAGALAASAAVLARTLDEGAGLSTAAVARELRATVEALTRDGDDGGDDTMADLLARLSAPVRDTPPT
ncbi:MAG: hypothetical protein HYR62_01955 [Actinobacteria bacterium]|nr:hypothetical protein [Actinomycetota bacterium]MBI3687247.1 hypothetical protein [Actinomycetota bacterium]